MDSQPMNDFDYLLRNFNDKLVLGVQPRSSKRSLTRRASRGLQKYVESTLVASSRVLCCLLCPEEVSFRSKNAGLSLPDKQSIIQSYSIY